MTRPPRDALRTEILAAAMRLFRAHGYAGTSLQQVADAAGCSKAALLYHFRSKSDMLRSLLDDLVAELEQLGRDLDATDPTERPRRALALSLALVVRHREPLAVLAMAGEEPAIAQMADEGEHWRDRTIAAMSPGMDPQTAAVRGRLFQHGLLGTCLDLPDLTDEQLTAHLLEVGRLLFPATV